MKKLLSNIKDWLGSLVSWLVLLVSVLVLFIWLWLPPLLAQLCYGDWTCAYKECVIIKEGK